MVMDISIDLISGIDRNLVISKNLALTFSRIIEA